MPTPWQPYREPLRTTLLRTTIIAAVAGAVLSLASGGRLRWPLATLLLFWFSFGGHWVELWYLNWLRPRLPATSQVHVAARITTWFVAGVVLSLGMAVTARAFIGVWPARSNAWWIGGVVFIGVELLAHLVLQLRDRPSFYNGQG